MKHGIFHLVYRTLVFYRKAVSYQLIIIILLSAVITGSLLTGFSVRQNLKTVAVERTGKTGIVISSGLRYFDPSMADTIEKITGKKNVSIIETRGFCQNFQTGKKVLNTKIYGIDDGFFMFLDDEDVQIGAGEIAVNTSLADHLNISVGDEVIVNFRKISDLPPNSPFAPSAGMMSSGVFRVGSIIDTGHHGDFSLGISQLKPDNIFINQKDLLSASGLEGEKSNRLLIEEDNNLSVSDVYNKLEDILTPEDLGLTLRKVAKTGENEIISSRVFIDSNLVNQIEKVLPEAKPVLTYMANSIDNGKKSTPYSFVAAIDSKNEPEITGNRIVINNWLADDLDASVNDTLTLYWYAPGKIQELVEEKARFIVSRIVGLTGLWSDSLLMPEFPGIAGSESCTDWDAGVEIHMDRIRKKDEDYWNKYRGTPKAFISYQTGRKLWGSNFGPATSIRVPGGTSRESIISELTGRIDPAASGFTVQDIKSDMIKAANESVDFSSLFISLGFFIIVSCLILLLLAVSSFFETRKEQISTLYSLGFTNRWIFKLLLTETAIIAVAGSILGGVSGLLFNYVVTAALNTVWTGAVQTNTLVAANGIAPVGIGVVSTFILSFVFLFIKTRRYLKRLVISGAKEKRITSSKTGLLFALLFLVMGILLLSLFIINSKQSIPLSFSAGGAFFVGIVLLWRQYALNGLSLKKQKVFSAGTVTGKYYSFNTSQAVLPVILIAAGLFAVIITGINRLSISDKSMQSSGGTGGYLLWAETSIPVKEDLTSATGMKEFGLDEPPYNKMIFVEALRSQGDNASCLNLNHITSPPLLGINPSSFISRKAFSFASLIPGANKSNPWEILNRRGNDNTIYGVADQTVLEWGLKKKTGDTLKLRNESGQLLNVIIAGGLKSSLFQGYILTGEESFSKNFPSVSGYSVFLVDGEKDQSQVYTDVLNARFENYGIDVQPARTRLATFFQVTNTYLSVFTILGGLGMILGVIGLGFVLRRNYNSRKREFALMMATGFSEKSLRMMILKEQVVMLVTGIMTGLISSIVATLVSIAHGTDIPWVSLVVITFGIVLTGLTSLFVSVRGIRQGPLVSSLRKE